MAIIYSYPTVTPVATDLVLGTDVSVKGKPTKNFTVQSIIDLVTTATGDLQFVLDLGATARAPGANSITLLDSLGAPGGSVNSFQFSTGTATIAGGAGTGFTDFTSTRLTGTIQAASAAQPNITSLGALTALVVNGAVSGTGVITSTTLVGASNTNIASTLAIKTYVDTQVGLSDTLSEVLANGNTTGATKIEVDNTSSGIDFIDDAKLRLGTGDDFEMYHANADDNTYLKETGAGSLELWASATNLKNAAGTETLLTATDGGSVDLYYNNVKAFETTATGSQVPTGVLTIPVGSEAAPSLTFASDPNTGIYRAAADTVGITAGGVLGLTVDATDTVIEGNFTCSNDFISQSATTATFGGKVSGSDPTANIEFATKGYVDTLVGGKTLEYAGDATGPFALNLATDDLEFNGDSNITVTAAAVAATKGIVTIDLNNDVTITGTMQAGTLSDGTFSGTTGTYTGGVSITSTTFVGALTGNASTATQLATSGTITTTGDVGLTGGPYTYTQGGPMALATTIADTIVNEKLLTNLSTATAQTITATDSIVEAFGYLQATITGLPSGLDYIGTWDARTVAEGGGSDGGTPDLRTAGLQVPGHYYIVATAGSATPNGAATTPDEWKIGDWVMRADATISEWQKIDNTSTIDGTGTANKIAKWTGTQTLGTGLIEDDGTDVTIGTSGNLIVEGNTTLGNANTDTATVKGPATFEESARFNVGISLGAATYGSAGDVLTSGGAAATVNSWSTPTTGTVTSVGLTETGSALTITGSPITSSGTLNIAGAGTAAQYINGALDLVTFPTVDNYQYWIISDNSTTSNITTLDTAVFAAGNGITTSLSGDTLTTAIDVSGTRQCNCSTKHCSPHSNRHSMV